MPELTQAPENGNPQAAADLAVIRRLMEGARESTSYNGSYLILWGCLIAAAETVTYLEGVGVVAVSLNLVWAVAVGIGFALSVLLGHRAWLRSPVNSLVDRMLAAIWAGCAIGLSLVGFLGSGGSVARLTSPGLSAVFFGSAFFASSFLPGRTAFLLLAAVWWIIGGSLLVWPFSGSGLVVAAALILFLALPGLLIRIRGAAPTESRVIE